MEGYTPIIILETEAEQRRPDPRVLSATGYPVLRRRTSRQRIGAWLVSFGTLLAGQSSTFDPEPELTLQEPT